MTWEETIEFIRNDPSYKDLVEKAYFEKDLDLNVQRFSDGEEFEATLELIRHYAPKAKLILDIGAGNGISSVAFANSGFEVHAVEPDPSDTIGAGAIRKLKQQHSLDNLKIYESFAEEIKFDNSVFDVVYVRQAMHHANDLNKFILECARVLKPGGLLLTVRDHVIYNKEDKEWFLEMHPLHKFYGGENAYTATEYRNAMTSANIEVQKELKHFDSVINYYPITKEEYIQLGESKEKAMINHLKRRLGILANIGLIQRLYRKKINFNSSDAYNEAKIPGRMYTYIGIKK